MNDMSTYKHVGIIRKGNSFVFHQWISELFSMSVCVCVSMCISNGIVHFKVKKREVDSTTTTDSDETISFSDSSSDSEPTFVYDESSSDNEQFDQ